MLSTLAYEILQKISNLGRFISFSIESVMAIGRVKLRLVVVQCIHLGIQSIPIVILTSLFIGMAFAIQVVKELLRFGAPDMVGGVVAMAIRPIIYSTVAI